MNFKVVSGYVVAFGVLGFTSYAIYKHVKNKEIQANTISSEEAKEEIARYRNAKMDESSEEFGEMMNEVRDQASWNRSFMTDSDHVIRRTILQDDNELEDDEKEEDLDDDSYQEAIPYKRVEEGEKLKHDPNSQEARQQFINMELSDFMEGNETYHTLLHLFDFPFNPVNYGDEDLKTKLIDYRVRFFGFASVWVQDVSFAEVILYYARAANFNYDETISYWADYFLQFNSLSYKMSSVEIDMVINKLNDHTYHNTVNPMVETWGLFGLTNVGMDNAIRIASRNVDQSVTYEIEFNEFLKSVS